MGQPQRLSPLSPYSRRAAPTEPGARDVHLTGLLFSGERFYEFKTLAKAKNWAKWRLEGVAVRGGKRPNCAIIRRSGEGSWTTYMVRLIDDPSKSFGTVIYYDGNYSRLNDMGYQGLSGGAAGGTSVGPGGGSPGSGAGTTKPDTSSTLEAGWGWIAAALVGGAGLAMLLSDGKKRKTTRRR